MKSFLSLLCLTPFLAYAEPEPAPKADSKPANESPPTLHNQRHAVYQQVHDQLFKGDFDALTKTAQEFRTTKAKFSDGNWKLDCFYGVFTASKAEEWPLLLEKLEEWNKHEAKDPAPVIAIAFAYKRWGKQARGGGWAKDVTEEGWKLLAERLKIAISRLVPEAQRCKSCPGFYDVLLTIGIDGQMDRKTFEDTFQAGTKLEPTYWPPYLTKAYYLLPRWFGKPGEVGQFIQDTATSNPEAALWVLYKMQYQGMDKNVFETEGISWETVKPSLIKCLGADPKKVAQANMLALLADTVGDQATVADALRPVGFMMDSSIWRSKTRWKEIQADFKSGKIK